jgi:hypothetical protein
VILSATRTILLFPEPFAVSVVAVLKSGVKPTEHDPKKLLTFRYIDVKEYRYRLRLQASFHGLL